MGNLIIYSGFVVVLGFWGFFFLVFYLIFYLPQISVTEEHMYVL